MINGMMQAITKYPILCSRPSGPRYLTRKMRIILIFKEIATKRNKPSKNEIAIQIIENQKLKS